MKYLLLLGFLLAFAAKAEIRKCTDANGKVTFSDSLCAGNTVNERGVKIHSNVQDLSSERRSAAESNKKERTDALLASPPSECKFRSSASQESKTLATNATRECIENLVSGASSDRHRQRWKDFWDSRPAAGGNSPMKCRPDFTGGFNCF